MTYQMHTKAQNLCFLPMIVIFFKAKNKSLAYEEAKYNLEIC